MSINPGLLFDQDGRRRGTYVYLLLCADNDLIHIKVGQSVSPLARLHQLKVGCPLPPKYLAFVHVGPKGLALTIEKAIHKNLKRWASHGEWFAVSPSEKAPFNAAIQDVLRGYRSDSKPLSIEQIPLTQLLKEAKQRQQLARIMYKRRGRAFQDFKNSSKG